MTAETARALFDQGRFAEAVYDCDRHLAQGHDPWMLQVRGLCRRALGDADGAVGDLRRVAAECGGDAEVLSNLAACLNAADRPDEALAALGRAAALAPERAATHYNMGNTLSRLGRVAEAALAFRRAVTLRPGDADAHWNLGIALMLLGDYRRGWHEMEWRRLKSFAPRRVEAPEWDGGPLAGKSLLVHAEQGLGDTVQFLRFVPHLAARGAVVHLAVHEPLIRLAEGFPGVASVCFLDGALPPTDLSVPMMSLPRLLGVEPATIPAWPYLAAAPERRAAWRERLPRSRPLIGVVWAGNPGHSNDANRSMPLDALAPLLALPARFCAVAKHLPDATAVARFPNLSWPGRDFADMTDTAAAIAEMDLIITVDTAAAHIAGALGRPTWILLPQVCDWRWLLGREDTPWYATARLFRQTRPGDWAGVVARVVAALEARLGAAS